jgi:hypothetical protein
MESRLYGKLVERYFNFSQFRIPYNPLTLIQISNPNPNENCEKSDAIFETILDSGFVIYQLPSDVRWKDAYAENLSKGISIFRNFAFH